MGDSPTFSVWQAYRLKNLQSWGAACTTAVREIVQPAVSSIRDSSAGPPAAAAGSSYGKSAQADVELRVHRSHKNYLTTSKRLSEAGQGRSSVVAKGAVQRAGHFQGWPSRTSIPQPLLVARAPRHGSALAQATLLLPTPCTKSPWRWARGAAISGRRWDGRRIRC